MRRVVLGNISMSLKVVLADGNVLCREGMVQLLQLESSTQVVGQSDNLRQALEMAVQYQADILILDPELTDQPVAEWVATVKTREPGLLLIAMLGRNEPTYCRSILEAGFDALVLRTSAFDNLRQAIAEVQLGKTYLCPKMQAVLDNADGRLSPIKLLSRRETEVLDKVAQGYSTKEIATQLRLSAKTVDTHRQHIMDKLKIRGIADLTRFAIREGITPLK